VLEGVDFRGSIDFELFLLGFAAFLLLFAFAVFPPLDDLPELFLAFLSLLAMLHGILDLNFKLYAFVVNGLIKGEIEKSSGPLLGLIVMSH
jgi:hypothetical protein